MLLLYFEQGRLVCLFSSRVGVGKGSTCKGRRAGREIIDRSRSSRGFDHDLRGGTPLAQEVVVILISLFLLGALLHFGVQSFAAASTGA